MRRVPFTGEPPQVSAGDEVWCRTANDEWIRKVAIERPRYDTIRAMGSRAYLTVPVSNVDDWKVYGAKSSWLNWPAEDVLPGDQPAPGPLWGTT